MIIITHEMLLGSTLLQYMLFVNTIYKYTVCDQGEQYTDQKVCAMEH